LSCLLCRNMTISVVTPTYYRHAEVPGLLKALAQQTLLPLEVILVDGAPVAEKRTEDYLAAHAVDFPFAIRYIRHSGGTAIQRNRGIDEAKGDIIQFFDDDVRPDPGYLQAVADVFANDSTGRLGGVAGFRRNAWFDGMSTARWRWYKRLRLLSVFEGGRYDYHNGYPINNNMVQPFTGTRAVDFMTTACSAYLRKVFGEGLRFDAFFIGFGVLEDAHLSLSAKRRGWQLLQCGHATAVELSSPSGRTSPYIVASRTCYNYYFVFKSICGPLTAGQKWRFFRFQLFELFRALGSMLSHPGRASWLYFWGKGHGIVKTLVKG